MTDPTCPRCGGTGKHEPGCREAIQPVRVVRSRLAGSKLTSPNGLPVVCVTRGTRWGNPYKPTPARGLTDELIHRELVASFRAALTEGRLPFTPADVKRDLRGKNLACWCKLALPCHADVLLEIANGVTPLG